MRTSGYRKLIKAVIPQALIRYRGPAAQNLVALTFDDGPVPGITDKVIGILAARGHRATFFVLGQNAESHPGLISSIIDSGCEVGNHSYSHVHLSRVRYAQIGDEVGRTERVLQKNIAGPSWFRPPGGILSWRLFLYLWRRGIRRSPVLWSVHVPHEHKKSSSEILDILRMASPTAGDIVLLHDDYPAIVDVLPAILDLLDERGLRSVPISELIEERPTAASRLIPTQI
jgi:peptidoglycan-N-acetylglucosamine deacetylase